MISPAAVATDWRAPIRLTILAIGLIFGLAACAFQASETPVKTPPAVSSLPARSPTLTPTATFRPAPTRSATPSASPTGLPAPLPSLTATPTAQACLDQVGRIETGTLRSDLLRLPMEFRIYLPPCYDQQTSQSYPVLYLIHGQNYNEDQWDRLGADETANRLITAGKTPPFIIVMPRDRSWSQPTEDNYGRVVTETLIPFIDANYRTLAEREGRAVGGLSRGAGWAIHLGLSQWELFSAIGAHSLPLFWTDLPHLRDWIAAIPPGSLPRIYMDLGDKERPQIAKSARWFEQLLTDLGIPHEWHLYPGYHEEAYWKSHLEEYLRWYAEGWKRP